LSYGRTNSKNIANWQAIAKLSKKRWGHRLGRGGRLQ